MSAFRIVDPKKHSLEPGSPEWLDHRAEQYNAGDAAAMLGCSTHTSRTELLDELHTGLTPIVSAAKQAVYDAGHRVEAIARPLAEKIMGCALYPLVFSADVVGPDGTRLLTRRLGASTDGSPLARPHDPKHPHHWECKSLNEALRAALQLSGYADIGNNDAKRLPKMYRVQMCQQAMVRGSTGVLFSAVEVDADGNVVDHRHCWYEPEDALCAEVVRGWIQLDEDLRSHQPVVHAERVKGETLEAIGLPVVRVMGSVVESNLPQWKALAIARIDGLNRELKTDDQFGQAVEDAKWCRASAKTMATLRSSVLAQMVTVNEVVTTLDELEKRLDDTGLSFEKLVDARQKEIRNEVVEQHRLKAEEHRTKMVARIEALGVTTAPSTLIPGISHSSIEADFAKAIKGLRTVKNLHDKAGAELTRVKMALSAETDKVETNLRHFDKECKDWRHLFGAREMADLVLKPEEDFAAVCKGRIDTAREAQRKTHADEEAALIAAKVPVAKRADLAGRRELLAELKARPIEAEKYGTHVASVQAAKDKAVEAVQLLVTEAEAAAAPPPPAPAPTPAAAAVVASAPPGQAFVQSGPMTQVGNVVNVPIATVAASDTATRAPASWGGRSFGGVPAGPVVDAEVKSTTPPTAPKGPPTLRLGVINDRLGFICTQAFLAERGYTGLKGDRNSILFHEEDFPAMCEAIAKHVASVGASHTPQGAS